MLVAVPLTGCRETFNVWPAARGDTYADGQVQMTFGNTNTTGEQKWVSAELDSEIFGSPVVTHAEGDDEIYAVSEDGTLYKFSPFDGATTAEFSAGGEVITSPALGNNPPQIYLGADTVPGTFYAIGETLGQNFKNWSFTSTGGVSSDPLVETEVIKAPNGKTSEADFVLFGTSDGKVYKLDSSGNQKWVFQAPPRSGSTSPCFCDIEEALATDGTNVYFTSVNGNGYAVSLANGQQTWQSPLPDDGSIVGPVIVSINAVAVGVVFVTDNHVLSLNPSNANIQWSTAVGTNANNGLNSAAAYSQGVLYVGAMGNLITLNATSGELGGTYNRVEEIGIPGSPVIGFSGATIFFTANDNVYAVNPPTQHNPNPTLEWTFPTPDFNTHGLAIGSDNTIYVGGDDMAGGPVLYAIH